MSFDRMFSWRGKQRIWEGPNAPPARLPTNVGPGRWQETPESDTKSLVHVSLYDGVAGWTSPVCIFDVAGIAAVAVPCKPEAMVALAIALREALGPGVFP